MQDLKIISGSSHVKLAEKVAALLELELTPMKISKFASNEIYAKALDTVRGADVYVIQTATTNVNEELVELFVILDSLKRSFARKIHVVMPYFPYARQDRVASPREPISAKLMANLIEVAGGSHVISFSLHSAQIQGFFNNPMDNVNLMRLFVEYFKKKSIADLVVVSPDAGGAIDAKKLADRLGVGMAILNKTRVAHNCSEVTHVVGDVEGKNCLIFDDMIDTAGSVCGAVESLRKVGCAGDIYLAATHPVFSGPAVSRLEVAGFKEIVVTDTIPHLNLNLKNLKVLSVAETIAGVIKNVHEHKSITNFYG